MFFLFLFYKDRILTYGPHFMMIALNIMLRHQLIFGISDNAKHYFNHCLLTTKFENNHKVVTGHTNIGNKVKITFGIQSR